MGILLAPQEQPAGQQHQGGTGAHGGGVFARLSAIEL